MPLDQFSSVTSREATSHDSDSVASAFLNDISRFHKENSALALTADAAIAVGALLSLTPQGRKLGSVMIDEAANAGRNFLKGGDDAAAQIFGTMQLEPAYAMTSLKDSASVASRFKPLENLGQDGLTVSMSSDGKEAPRFSDVFADLRDDQAKKTADLRLPNRSGEDTPLTFSTPRTSEQLAHEQEVQNARLKDGAALNDQTGRPVSEANVERVAEAHKPLSAQQLQAERRGLEEDMTHYKGSDTQSVLDKWKSSGLSDEQKDRVLNVFSEIRHSYLQPDANGQVSSEQINSYRHTIGELSEGLDSAARRGLDPTTTQNSLLAALVSDSHKAGWSASTGGNFFTHHLDGAIAADTILSRQIGEGFSSQDLDAVSHAILEHQIGPPGFMGGAYAGELRAGMLRAGVTATERDSQSIANIQRLISDPLHAPVEADSQGGYRVAFNNHERGLLQTYVGNGTQNWHVPNASNRWNDVSQGVLSADSLDNYFPRVGADGVPITGPFKIASLRGPRALPPDLIFSDAIKSMVGSANQALSLLPEADRAVAVQRLADSDKVYNPARTATESWLRQRLSLPADASIPSDTPYWSKAIQGPPALSAPEQIQAWRQSPETGLADDIQQHFADELFAFRLRH